jgi:GH24 family phage-related lysozyme (muramidase)
MRDGPNQDRPASATSLRAVSESGLAFIKAHEGFRARAAKLPDGRWLIGYSSVDEVGEDGAEIAQAEAEERLLKDLAPVEAALNALVFAPLSQSQFDALASLGFSIGVEALRASGVADALNDGRPIDAAKVFDAWTHASVGGEVRVVDALVRRRAAEKAMFLAPDDGPVAASSALLRPVATASFERASSASRGASGPDPALIARLNRILPEPPADMDESVRVTTGRVTELGEARSKPRAAEAIPAAPYPLRRGMTSPGPAGLRGDRPASRPLSRVNRGGALALEGAAEWVEAWPWALCGGGLALVAAGAANMRNADAGPNTLWVLAVVAGVLTAAVGGYLAARRLAGHED